MSDLTFTMICLTIWLTGFLITHVIDLKDIKKRNPAIGRRAYVNCAQESFLNSLFLWPVMLIFKAYERWIP